MSKETFGWNQNVHSLHYFHFKTSFIFEGDSVLWFQGSSQETLRLLSITCFYFHFGKMFYFMMLSFNWKDDFWLHRFETNCCFLNFLISAFFKFPYISLFFRGNKRVCFGSGWITDSIKQFEGWRVRRQ